MEKFNEVLRCLTEEDTPSTADIEKTYRAQAYRQWEKSARAEDIADALGVDSGQDVNPKGDVDDEAKEKKYDAIIKKINDWLNEEATRYE